jgi:hypothetical protein
MAVRKLKAPVKRKTTVKKRGPGRSAGFKHSAATIKKMKKSAKARWAGTKKPSKSTGKSVKPVVRKIIKSTINKVVKKPAKTTKRIVKYASNYTTKELSTIKPIIKAKKKGPSINSINGKKRYGKYKSKTASQMKTAMFGGISKARHW